jgi:hypothetical protein
MRILVICLILLGFTPAFGQTPREIQGQIAAGQAQAALGELQGIVAAHPDSGVAWYLTAEARDATGDEAGARDALAKAEQFSPGLPFANPSDLAALQARVAPRRGFGVGHVALVIGGIFFIFMLLRAFSRRRVTVGYPGGYGAPPPGYGPEGGFGGGGGLGSSLISGLAAGAGFAAGERIIDDFTGRTGGGFDDGPALPPAADDGLQGDPGWNDDGGGTSDDGW